MDKKFVLFEKSIKSKHSFRFTPKFKEEFEVKLKPRLVVEIAIKAIEALDWEVVYSGDNQIEARRMGDIKQWSNKISIKIEHLGRVEVKSVSLGNEMWDFGGNSKRVKLFIYAFNEFLKEFDDTKLAELEKEVEKKDNWDDYQLPETLPAPKKYIQPQIAIPIIGTFLVSMAIAYVIAFLSVEGLYVFGIYEFGIGLLFAFSLQFLINMGNYTHWKNIKLILGGAVILTFMMNQIFQYQFVLSKIQYGSIGFFEFIRFRLEQGLTIKKLDVGTFGLLIFWVLQPVLTYTFGYMKTFSVLAKFAIERVPAEVIDFAVYHFVKSKNETVVKQELSKMGWKSDLEHQMVFEAIEGVQGANELVKG